jgi:hypothetical protein
MSAQRDSHSGRQYHVRYGVPESPDARYWSTVTDDEAEALAILAMVQRVYAKEGVAMSPPTLYVRDVSPWRDASVPVAEHTVWDHYGTCGYCSVSAGPCMNPDDAVPWPIERLTPAAKPHPSRPLKAGDGA